MPNLLSETGLAPRRMRRSFAGKVPIFSDLRVAYSIEAAQGAASL
jgi:hypothetical protein